MGVSKGRPSIGFLLYCKPISVNHYLHSNKFGRKYLSVEAKEFQKLLAEKLSTVITDTTKEKAIMELYTNKELVVCITLGFGDRRKRDVDNYSKMILDGLQGTLFSDDAQIVRLEIEKKQPVEKSYIKVEVGIRWT